MNNFCLYHNNCADGFASALAVWLKYGNDFKYIPVQYNEPLPKEVLASVKTDKIFIVDFSYPREVLEELETKCDNIVLIDHHDQEGRGIEDWTPKNGIKIINHEHSGCVLTWKFLFPDQQSALFFEYVQDRDLWTWNLPNSREFSAGLALQEMDFGKWYLYFNDPEYLINDGQVVLKYINKTVKNLAKKAVIITNDDGHKVVTINSCLFQSELGEILCKNEEVNYADIYFILHREDQPAKIIHSLRSNGKVNVAEVAKLHGGGGHRNAAGYSEEM